MNKNESNYCKENIPDTLYKIGMFAGMKYVTIKALRYYDEIQIPVCKVGEENE